MADMEIYVYVATIFLSINSTLCLRTYAPPVGANLARIDLITSYFHLGYSYKEIIAALLIVHSITLSMRHLKRILAQNNLKRRKYGNWESPYQQIAEAILKEIQGSGQCLGYRAMWQCLVRTHGLHVYRDTVLRLMWIIDPEGMERRKAKRFTRRQYSCPGPNHVWHIDGYDKLKPFGFAIHGAIDGFSRKIMWLEVGASNNDPHVVAKNYLDCIEKLKYVPRIMRSDLGTENSVVKLLQAYFRPPQHNDPFAGTNSFIMGKSTSNQRIEAWWCILRKQGGQFWMNLFKDLRELDLYRDDIIHKECLRYCFMTVIENELSEIAKRWNLHTINSKKCADTPRGKPEVMHTMPELYNTRSFHTAIDINDIPQLRQLYGTPRQQEKCKPEFQELFELLIPNLSPPVTLDAAIECYGMLVEKIRNIF